MTAKALQRQPTPEPIGVDPNFPLAHRTDLPEHERGISAEAWAMLQQGIEAVKRGEPTRVLDPSEFWDEEEDNEEG